MAAEHIEDQEEEGPAGANRMDEQLKAMGLILRKLAGFPKEDQQAMWLYIGGRLRVSRAVLPT